MKKIIWTALLFLPLVGCASLRLANGSYNVPLLISYVSAGIEADCAIGTDALSKDICTFGRDAITAANAATTSDPKAALLAAQHILTDAAVKKPALHPYIDWFLRLSI